MIIAVDFDGVLCEDRFPEIGSPYYRMIMFVRELMDEGHEVILWTSRTMGRLEEAVEWCRDYGLHFCAVNENAPSNRDQYISEYPDPSPKVYADLYLDDNDPWFMEYERSYGHEGAIAHLIKRTEAAIDRNRLTVRRDHDER